MITAGDVIWIYDGTIRPRKNKMCVCLCPENGFFFRVNTKGHWNGSVEIKAAEYNFLDHDSHVECDGPLEIDDSSIDESIRVDGILGSVSSCGLSEIMKMVSASKTIRPNDKKIIITAIEAVLRHH